TQRLGRRSVYRAGHRDTLILLEFLNGGQRSGAEARGLLLGSRHREAELSQLLVKLGDVISNETLCEVSALEFHVMPFRLHTLRGRPLSLLDVVILFEARFHKLRWIEVVDAVLRQYPLTSLTR